MTTDALFETPGAPVPGESGAAALRGEAGPAVPPITHRGLTTEDRDWALRMYSAFARGGDDEQLYVTTVPGNPWSKSRPRFAKRTGRTYQPRDDREAEARLRGHLAVRGPMFTGNVMIVCRFYRGDLQRIDTDNLLKHVCDSATGILWADDSQVTLVLGELHLDRDNPRTVILAGNHQSTLTRGSDYIAVCEQCGETFRRVSNNPHRRTCSRKCWQGLRGLPDLTVPVPCAGCGTPFVRRTSAQKYCSRPCVNVVRKGSPRGRRRVSRCSQCGAQLAHNRGGRCRDCWRSSPKGQPAPVQTSIDEG